MSAVAEILIKGRVDSSLTRATQAATTQLSATGAGAARASTLAASAGTQLARATQGVDRAARAAGGSTSRLADATGRVGAALSRVTTQAREAGRAILGLGEAGKGGGLGDLATSLGTGSVLKKSFGASLNTEAAQVRLATAINADDKGAAVQAATAAAEAFARRAPVNKTQVLDVNYALNSAGLQADVARAGAEAVTKVATVTNGQASQVAEIMATAYNNLGQSIAGPETEKMAKIGDMMTKVQLKYQIRDFGQLGEGIAFASATASSAKIPMEDMLMMLGQLNTAGVTGGRAGTSMTAVFRSMSKASKELGFEIVRDDKGMLDYVATMQGLNEALADYDDVDVRNDKLQEIFGDEGKAGIIPLLAALDKAKSDQKEILTAADVGLTEEEFNRFVNARGGKLQVIMNSVSGLGEAITDSLLPAVDRLAGPLIGLTGYMTDLIREFPLLGQAVGVAMAAMGSMATLRLLRGGAGMLTRLGGGAAVAAGGVPVRVTNAGALGGAGGIGGVGGASRLGRLGRFGRLAGRLGGGLLGAATYLPDVIDAAGSGDNTRLGGSLGGMGGGLAGAAAGAAIGSVVPVIGTAIGGLVGGLLGSFGGEKFGAWIGSLTEKTAPADASAKAEGKQVTNTSSTTFNVYPSAGMDEEAFARKVARQQQEASRGALFDE